MWVISVEALNVKQVYSEILAADRPQDIKFCMQTQS